VIPRLEEVDAITSDEANEAMFLGEASRPGPWRQVLQWFGLANALKRIARDRLNQVEDPESNFPICLHPMA
jgi:hypothetical protein